MWRNSDGGIKCTEFKHFVLNVHVCTEHQLYQSTFFITVQQNVQVQNFETEV